jgi:hypothetical protein
MKDTELVTAQSSDRIVFAHRISKGVGTAFYQIVPRAMT